MSLSKPKDESIMKKLDVYNPLAVGRFIPASARLSAILRRLIVLLSSVSGLDRAFMLVNYGFPLLAQLATRSVGLSKTLSPYLGGKLSVTGLRRLNLAVRLRAAAAKASDLRMGMRMFGLLSIIAGTISLEQKAAQSKTSDWKMLNIQRLQMLSMLIYYPLEHAYYLGAHGVLDIPADKRLKSLLWACRAWLAYLALDLYKQSSEARVLSKRMSYVSSRRQRDHQKITDRHASTTSEKIDAGQVDSDALVEQGTIAVEEAALAMNEKDCIEQSKALINAISSNLAYLPPSIHWVLPNGLYANAELWTGIFGSLVSFYGLRAKWAATA